MINHPIENLLNFFVPGNLLILLHQSQRLQFQQNLFELGIVAQALVNFHLVNFYLAEVQR